MQSFVNYGYGFNSISCAGVDILNGVTCPTTICNTPIYLNTPGAQLTTFNKRILVREIPSYPYHNLVNSAPLTVSFKQAVEIFYQWSVSKNIFDNVVDDLQIYPKDQISPNSTIQWQNSSKNLIILTGIFNVMANTPTQLNMYIKLKSTILKPFVFSGTCSVDFRLFICGDGPTSSIYLRLMIFSLMVVIHWGLKM